MLTYLHSWYLWTDVALSLFWGHFIDLQMTPAQCEKKRKVLFPTQCIWIPSVSSQAQVNHFPCVFLSSQEQESALTKLNTFHNWQAMCLVLIEPHFHLLKWKAHGKSRAPGSDQLLSYWATTQTHSNAQSQKTEKRDSSIFFEKDQLNACIAHYLAIRHRCAVWVLTFINC